MPATPVSRIESRFDTSPDGWTITADATNLVWVSDAAGGHIRATDAFRGPVFYYVAPDDFTGDRGGFFGGSLSYSVFREAGGLGYAADDVILTGGGLTLAWNMASLPWTGDWTEVTVDFTAAAGWRLMGGGAATEAQLRQVLGDLEALQIRGDQNRGLDTSRLDNVVMTAAAPVLITTYDETGAVAGTAAFASLAAGLAAAEAGGRIDISGLASSLATHAVADDGLTIAAEAGFSARLQLAAGIAELSVEGGAAIRVIANTAANALDFTGSTGSNTAFAMSGNDTLAGGTGRDDLDGGDGRDLIQGGAGNDFLKGNLGVDTLHGGEGDDSLKGGDGRDLQHGDGGNDTVRGGFGNDAAWGGEGDDALFGEGHNDNLTGAAGNDLLDGGTGNDSLGGGHGDDVLIGGTGDDRLTGSRGIDRMTGGTGADVFVFADAADSGTGLAADSVTDFAAGADRIDLTGLGALDFIGAGPFTGLGQLSYDAATGVLSANLAGDPAAEFELLLTTRPALTEADLILA